MCVVKILEPYEVEEAIHPLRRVVIVRRDDGHFSFAEQCHYLTEHEGEVIAEGWNALAYEGIYETADIAEREARAAYPR